MNTYLTILVYQVRSLADGGLQAWDPLMFMGLNTYGLAYTFANPLTYLAASFPTDSLFSHAAAISCALLVATGVASFRYIQDVVHDKFASLVGSTMYLTSAFAITKSSQEDMSLAPIALIPLGFLAIRRAHRSAAKSFACLCGVLAMLLYFTFLQHAAYAGLLMAAYAAYRAWRTRSSIPLVTFVAAGVVSVVCALPRLISVAQAFGNLQRSMAGASHPSFEQVYAFQNVQPTEFLRLFDDGIFGRFPSEVVSLGNNLNLHEGLLLYSSTFGSLLVVLAAMSYIATRFRIRTATNDELSFHILALVCVLLVVLVKPVQQVLFHLFLNIDFSHARIVIAGLLPMSVLGAFAVHGLSPGRTLQGPSGLTSHLAQSALGVLVAGLVMALVYSLAGRGAPTRIALAGGPGELAAEMVELLTVGSRPSIPTAPDGLGVLEVSRTAIHLGWKDVAGETRYEVEESTNVPSTGARVSVGLANYASYWIDNLVPGQIYTFRVRACSDSGCSDFSSAVSTITPPSSATDATPGSPAQVRAVADTSTHVWVEWAGTPSADSYRIEMQRGSGGDFEEIGVAPGVASAYEINDVGHGQTFGFRLRACKQELCSSYSPAVTATTPEADGDQLPLPPRGLTVTGTRRDELTATWQPVDGESSITAEVKAENSETFVQTSARTSAPGQAIVTGLQPDTTYALRARTCVVGRCSVPSNVVEVTTPRPAEASAPPVQNIWLLSTELARVLWSIVALGAMSIAVRLWGHRGGVRVVLARALGVIVIVEGLAFANLQINGDQNRTLQPFAQGNLLVADARDFKIPVGVELQAVRQRLEADTYRSSMICDPAQFQAFCAPWIAHAWGLRVPEGYSSGVPARLGLLPWPDGAVSLRAINFSRSDQISWPLASLLNVKYVLEVNVPFYEHTANVEHTDRPLSLDDVVVHENPGKVVPRVFFSANVEPVSDAATAVSRLFSADASSLAADVETRSFAEGLSAPGHYTTAGGIDAAWRGDTVDITLDDADESRFLILNELYDPSWHATGAGAELRVYPTNDVMRGVVVPAHVTHVVFSFIPFFNAGSALISGLVALAMLVVIWRIFRRNERGAGWSLPLRRVDMG